VAALLLLLRHSNVRPGMLAPPHRGSPPPTGSSCSAAPGCLPQDVTASICRPLSSCSPAVHHPAFGWPAEEAPAAGRPCATHRTLGTTHSRVSLW
jgi:hypothetical protein